MPYDVIWVPPDTLEETLQDGLGLREQDLADIMQMIHWLSQMHWHYNPVEEPGTGGYTENARSSHAAVFYNSLGWNG